MIAAVDTTPIWAALVGIGGTLFVGFLVQLYRYGQLNQTVKNHTVEINRLRAFKDKVSNDMIKMRREWRRLRAGNRDD